MAIKNYTTKVSSVQSLSEIQSALVTHGAKKIMMDYDDNGKALGITFSISISSATKVFYLTANVDGVLQVFRRQKVRADKDQAERTAWRNVRDWIMAQMAFIESGNATMDEVFLPYITDGKKTLYEAYIRGECLLPEYKGAADG